MQEKESIMVIRRKLKILGIPQEKMEDSRLILLYKGLKGKASIPTEDLMAFQTPIANTDVYKGSFFPQTIHNQGWG